MKLGIKIDYTKLENEIRKKTYDLDFRVRKSLEDAGDEIIEYLRSYTGQLKPDGRMKHPGEWADITYHLKESFYNNVTKTEVGWVLTLGNDASYAIFLDRKRGYYVLSGVIDSHNDFGVGIIRKHFKRAQIKLG